MGAPLAQLLTPGTVLLAASQRLCRQLAQQHARECRAKGIQVWETPEILTLGAWLVRLWRDAIDSGADQRLLLTPVQEAALWERVIDASQPEGQLFSATATAGLAADAWSLMHAWRLRRADVAVAGHEDVLSFVEWADAFDESCRSGHWLDSARLPDALVELIAAKRIPLPARLLFAGFDDIAPQLTRLMDALRAAGCAVATLEAGAEPRRVRRVALASADEEVLAAARWARALLDARPAARIGVLAPDLAAHGHSLRRVFDEVLLPDAMLPGHEEAVRPYNISLGEPLAAHPMVASALAILELARGSLPLAQLTTLLCSPFLAGGDGEMTARAALDVEIRSAGDTDVSLGALARALRRTEGCPLLAQRMTPFRELAASPPRAQSPSHWLARFARLLAALGWPGDRSRSSTEHQAIEAWRKLLSGFGALDLVTPSMPYADALARLRSMAREMLFQRETPETPVQILGVFEASGFEFDALWVTGLHDEVWPASAKPNPFLPIAVQRRHRLPHASAERELEFCARLTQRLLRSAPEVVLSHPRREEDRDLRASPLIRAFAETAVPAIEASPLPRYRDVVHASSRRERIVDHRAPALDVGAMVRGGTALFRSQSACPFRGFAEFRLHAREFPEPQPGLSAADRGTLIHDVLAEVWQQLESHERLTQLAPDDIAARVQKIVSAVVGRLAQRRPGALTHRLAALESERLVSLVLEWLELEKTRAPFSVRREETKVNLRVGELRTDARMDRVDQLADGSFAVIDYKTGEAKTPDWFGNRPAEPQLPLYALYGFPRERVGALLFGKLRRGECGFVGIARSENVVPRVGAYESSKLAAAHGHWETLFDRWDATLTGLAAEHRLGEARVSPRDKKVCEYCHLHGFCRVYQRRARLVGVGEESDG